VITTSGAELADVKTGDRWGVFGRCGAKERSDMRIPARLVVVALALAGAVSLHAQRPGPQVARPASQVPRMADGHPDLQGMWTNATLTPLERPAVFNGRATVSESEAAKYAADFLEANDIDRRDGPKRLDVERAYNNIFLDRGTELALVNGQRRPSLIVDPADGHKPPLTADAQRRLGNRRSGGAAGVARVEPDNPESAPPSGSFDNPEERPLAERCLLSFGSSSGPPMLPVLYNNHYQIVQTPGYVMILVEMVHDVRVIPTDGRPHGTARRWLGDSVGHWEGDTLVVETINFNKSVSFQGSTENLHVVERFTRVDANTILYKFTIDDPSTWTRSWSGEVPLRATDEMLYEYACHEANYALENILRGARARDPK
jgi:hypothetical protein